ncbi:MAG: 30S ribosomal protein S6 [Acidobacteria bacterium]|nr:30S ribosomal protein S6 [Acidobacteriota bacterium]
MFISAPTVADDDLSRLVSNLKAIVTERGGNVTKEENRGKRTLAYRIDKFNEGIYTLLYIEGSGNEISEVERRLRVTDFVIRHITVRTDEDLKRAEKVKAKRRTSPSGKPATGESDLDDVDDSDIDDLD